MKMKTLILVFLFVFASGSVSGAFYSLDNGETTSYLTEDGGTLTGELDVSGGSITGLGAPTSGTDPVPCSSLSGISGVSCTEGPIKTNSFDSTSTSSLDSSTQDSTETYVDVTGDTLEGPLDMSGFGLTGLPSPDDPSDAATKSYVDDVNSSVNLENYATESFVLDLVSNSSDNSVNLSGYATEDYVDNRVSEVSVNSSSSGSTLDFASGIELGEASAFEDSLAAGRDAETLGVNSFAFGTNSSAAENEFAVGSEEERVDLSVSGDLNVEGSLEGVNVSGSQKSVYSYSFATDPNGTDVNLPSEVEEPYTVTATSVNSLADTGVFNKTAEGFSVVSSEFTKVDVQVAENSE